jgi:hypothetical protein
VSGERQAAATACLVAWKRRKARHVYAESIE